MYFMYSTCTWDTITIRLLGPAEVFVWLLLCGTFGCTAGSTDAPHNLCRSPERILNPASEV
ncbi:hypothetical protein I7I53_00283 [Histoplasma capsulatum var. duboisii H88]|uniref:Uncharacterized protein n=1 Tax=Ajellomyces capsulatus (strain H88) TaxID=544711 RepID=A0A8A1LHZ2_AJEC8|nr:hypothetical protein I7I53_00283 [Histoplasma capsulatum var. duboisii H88]